MEYQIGGRTITLDRAKMSHPQVPESTIEGLFRYIVHGAIPDSFLQAVLENNLTEAFGRADEANIVALFATVRFLYNDVPGNCWGNPGKVRAWVQDKNE